MRRGHVAVSVLLAAIVGCVCSPESPVARDATVEAVRYGAVDVEGVRVFYREAGPRGAPTIVLLHGFPSSSFMFRDLIPRLATRYHVLAPDYPGFGNSACPPPREFAYTFEHLSVVVERFLDALHVDRAALFVHDYGGPIGLRFAVRKPERVTAFIVQNANAYDEGLSPLFFKLKRPLWQNRTAESEAPLRAFLASGAFRSMYTTGLRNPERVGPDGPDMDQVGLDRPGNLDIQVELQTDYRSNLPEYAAWQRYLREKHPPLLVVWGKNDPIFLEPGARAYARDVPDAEIHLLDTGHFALEEDAATTASFVLDFLDRRAAKVPK